jgi:hypothetical protein
VADLKKDFHSADHKFTIALTVGNLGEISSAKVLVSGTIASTATWRLLTDDLPIGR